MSEASPAATPASTPIPKAAEPTWLSISVLSLAKTWTLALSPVAALLTVLFCSKASVLPEILLTVTVPEAATPAVAPAATPAVTTTLSISCLPSAAIIKPVFFSVPVVRFLSLSTP